MILPLYLVLVLEYYVDFWAQQYETDMDILRRTQQKATKVIQVLEHL